MAKKQESLVLDQGNEALIPRDDAQGQGDDIQGRSDVLVHDGMPLAPQDGQEFVEEMRLDETALLTPTVEHPADTEAANEFESELAQMSETSVKLHQEGMISHEEVREQQEAVERTRKLYREMSPAERAAVNRRRREMGRQIVTRQLAGTAVIPIQLKINHTRLRPLFEQWWPFMNRMSVNITRFGGTTFGKDETEIVSDWFEEQLKKLEAYVDNQWQTTLQFRELKEREMRAANDIVLEPSVALAALELNVEAYTRYSWRVLDLFSRFDALMDQFDFLIWNGQRDQADVDSEVVRFVRKFTPVGVRAYTTHLRLMTTIYKL